MMLFLGAGASKRFGLKTMEELSKEFENSANRILRRALSDEEEALYHKIIDALSTNNLEDILTVLNDLSEESQRPTVKYLKSQLNIMIRNRSIVDLLSETLEYDLPQKLQTKIIHCIKESCVIKENEEILADIVRVYNRLFEILKLGLSSSFDIFTTNYDLIIEKYYDLLTNGYYLFKKKYNRVEKRKMSYTDGFLNTVFTISFLARVVNEDIWNPERYDDAKKSHDKDIPLLRLFKLHGSIDQYYHNGEIIKSAILIPTRTVAGIELKDSTGILSRVYLLHIL